MKYLLLVAVTILAVGRGEKAEVKPESVSVNAEELEEREDIIYLKGLDVPYTGKAFKLYGNGMKNQKIYKDGKAEGLSVTWHKNGQKNMETNFKDGKLDGPAVSWYENGQKHSEINFKDGEPDGPMNAWHENGQKAVEGKNKDGKPDGLYVSWHKNGQKQAEGNFKEGKPDGLFVEWHENGQKMSERNYKDGKEISAKYWNSKGEPVDSEEEALNNP